jgi:hypothetical protein
MSVRSETCNLTAASGWATHEEIVMTKHLSSRENELVIGVAGQACFVTARTTRSGYRDRELRNLIRQSCDKHADKAAQLIAGQRSFHNLRSNGGAMRLSGFPNHQVWRPCAHLARLPTERT